MGTVRSREPELVYNDADPREVRLGKQLRALELLSRRGLSGSQMRKLLQTTSLTIRNWQSGRRLARPLHLSRLLEAAQHWSGFMPGLTEAPARPARTSLPEDKARRDRIVRKLGIQTPARRARLIERILADTGATREELAGRLSVSVASIYSYLDPRKHITISLAVAEKLFEASRSSGGVTPPDKDLIKRYEKAWRVLLGDHQYEAGFQGRNLKRKAVAAQLNEFTKITSRHFYRLLSQLPLRNFPDQTISKTMLTALESAANELGRLPLPTSDVPALQTRRRR